jgi:ferredoxin
MKLEIDPSACMGHGRCYRIATEWLSYDDEGYVTPRGVPIDVPPDQHAVAEEVVDTCPEQAISLTEE